MWWKNWFNWFWKNRVNKWLYQKKEKPFTQKSKPIDYSKLKDLNVEIFRWKIEMVLWNEALVKALIEKDQTQEPKIAMVWTIWHMWLEDLVSIPKDDHPRIIVVWGWVCHDSLLTRLVLVDVMRILEKNKK